MTSDLNIFPVTRGYFERKEFVMCWTCRPDSPEHLVQFTRRHPTAIISKAKTQLLFYSDHIDPDLLGCDPRVRRVIYTQRDKKLMADF